jgi:hypothetical protein
VFCRSRSGVIRIGPFGGRDSYRRGKRLPGPETLQRHNTSTPRWDGGCDPRSQCCSTEFEHRRDSYRPKSAEMSAAHIDDLQHFLGLLAYGVKDKLEADKSSGAPQWQRIQAGSHEAGILISSTLRSRRVVVSPDRSRRGRQRLHQKAIWLCKLFENGVMMAAGHLDHLPRKAACAPRCPKFT